MAYSDQSWIDPGAAAGGEAGRTGADAGAGVAGAAREGAGILDFILLIARRLGSEQMSPGV